MDLERYQEQMKRLKQQRAELERVTRDQDQRERHEYATARALADLQRFCQNVVVGVDSLSFEEGQRLMRLLIDSVNVEGGLVSIETVIPLAGDGDGPMPGSGQSGRPGRLRPTSFRLAHDAMCSKAYMFLTAGHPGLARWIFRPVL